MFTMVTREGLESIINNLYLQYNSVEAEVRVGHAVIVGTAYLVDLVVCVVSNPYKPVSIGGALQHSELFSEP